VNQRTAQQIDVKKLSVETTANNTIQIYHLLHIIRHLSNKLSMLPKPF
jgi:hypothetical protein